MPETVPPTVLCLPPWTTSKKLKRKVFNRSICHPLEKIESESEMKIDQQVNVILIDYSFFFGGGEEEGNNPNHIASKAEE